MPLAAAGRAFGSGVAIQASEELGIGTLAVAVHLAAAPAGNVVAAEHRDINAHVLAANWLTHVADPGGFPGGVSCAERDSLRIVPMRTVPRWQQHCMDASAGPLAPFAGCASWLTSRSSGPRLPDYAELHLHGAAAEPVCEPETRAEEHLRRDQPCPPLLERLCRG